MVSSGLLVVRHKNKYGCINPKGEIVIPFEFSRLEPFSEGLALARRHKNEKFGYIDTSGKFVIPPVFESFSTPFNDGTAKAVTGETWVVLNSEADVLWPKDFACPCPATPASEDAVEFDDIYEEIGDFVDSGRFEDALDYLRSCFEKIDCRSYDIALSLRFTNDADTINRQIDHFIDQCQKDFDLKAVYLEMNGFYINPDLWYFDYFGYDYCEDEPKLDSWLAEWESKSFPPTTLAGFESLQRLYERKEFGLESEDNHDGDDDKAASLAREMSDLWVLLSFMKLIDDACKARKQKRCIPLLFTAHDYDMTGRCLI